jgi:hypothetical protein
MGHKKMKDPPMWGTNEYFMICLHDAQNSILGVSCYHSPHTTIDQNLGQQTNGNKQIMIGSKYVTITKPNGYHFLLLTEKANVHS